MKSQLRYTAIAMMWGMILWAAYAAAYPQTGDRNPQTQAAAPPQAANTPGRIAKFTTTKAVGDSNITEGNNGNIGIGTTLPTSTLTVNGVIEMLSGGGIKFRCALPLAADPWRTSSRHSFRLRSGRSRAPWLPR